jgi:hypothetical protein
MSSEDEDEDVVASAEDEDEVKAAKKVSDRVKKQLLTDIEAVGSLACVGKGKLFTLQRILQNRRAVYANFPRNTLANWFYYWKRLDPSVYQGLLDKHNVVSFFHSERVESAYAETMSTTGGPGGRRAPARGNNNNNNNNNAPAAGGGFPGGGFPGGPHIGKFQGESCLRFLLASNLATHMRTLL